MITGVIKNKIDKIWTDIWLAVPPVRSPLSSSLDTLCSYAPLTKKELENEEFANMTGETADLIFPRSEIGQAMRWSKFKDIQTKKF